MRILLSTLIAAGLAGAAAAESPRINPGEWESTTTTSVSMNANGQAMQLPGQTMSSTECITEEDAEFDEDDFAQEGCTVSNFQTTATTASFDLACTQNGMTMNGSMAVESTDGGDSYKGEFNIAGSAAGMGDMTVTGQVVGKRIGACS